MIPLMKSAFHNEVETREELTKFILRAGQLSMGEQCAKFEKGFAEFQGARDAVLFNSGGSANLAMFQTLKNLGRIAEGARIGFSALTWSTNVMPIIQLGFKPVPIDCKPTTLNVMSDLLERRLEESDIKLVFVTNALGFAGDLHKIKEVCRERNIILIEDNCEALGTELQTGRTGTFGEMASFSFFVAHHMSTIEGGMVCTDDDELSEMLRIVRANGWDRNLNASQQHKWRKRNNVHSEFEAKYTFYDLGYNLRPTEITGFLGCYQLAFLRDNVNVRDRNYKLLESIVKENPDLIPLDRSHISLLSSFAFPVLCGEPKAREKYMSQFSGAGVEIRPMIAGNIQNQPFYRKYVAEACDLPGTEKIHECGFYCGNYPELTESDLQTLSSCLSRY